MTKVLQVKPGDLLICKKENYILCNIDLAPVIFNGGFAVSEIGDVMMYISKKFLKKKTYYQVLYIDNVYYIQSGAFKNEARNTNSNKTSRIFSKKK